MLVIARDDSNLAVSARIHPPASCPHGKTMAKPSGILVKRECCDSYPHVKRSRFSLKLGVDSLTLLIYVYAVPWSSDLCLEMVKRRHAENSTNDTT